MADFGKWAGTFGAPSHLYDKGTTAGSQFIWDPLGMFAPPPGVDFNPEAYQADPEFAAALARGYRGEGPSAAQSVLARGLDESARQAMGLANSQRGVDPALAARMGMAAAADVSRRGVQDAATLRAQEMQSAQQRYLQLEQIRAQQEAQRNQLDLQKALREQKSAQQAKGGMVGAIGGIAAAIASDESAKRQIAPLAWDDVQEFLRGLRPSTYTYAEPTKPGRREGPQVGVIAQGIRNTRIGRTFVEPTADGLVLNAHGAISALLAVVGAMGQRIEQLEAAQEAPGAH